MKGLDNCGRCFGASFGDCDDCVKMKEDKMSDLIRRDDAIRAVVECDEVRGFAFKMVEEAINKIPAVVVEDPDALKPCPFCGGEARVSKTSFGDHYYIECDYCGASTPEFGREDTARESWNVRTEK